MAESTMHPDENKELHVALSGIPWPFSIAKRKNMDQLGEKKSQNGQLLTLAVQGSQGAKKKAIRERISACNFEHLDL